MNIPAIAARSFNRLKHDLYFRKIAKAVETRLKKLKNFKKRANFTHTQVDEKVQDLFLEDELVSSLVQCKKGCNACCFSQVSVTLDEARLLSEKIENGLKIDWTRLAIQAKVENSSEDFYSIAHSLRKCIFLNEKGGCSIYEDRPMVCRTNFVVSDPKLCETKSGKQAPINLLKTYEADMVIYAAFRQAKKSGSLASMIWKELKSSASVLPIAKKKETDVEV